MLVISSIIHGRRQWDTGFVKMFNIFTQFLHRGHTSSCGIDIPGGTACISVYILLFFNIQSEWWKTNFHMYACFQFCMGIIMTHLIQNIKIFFISNPDPNKLQRSSWLNLLVNIYLLHLDYMKWSNDMLSSNKIWAADMMLKNIILIYGMVNLFF